MRIKQIKLSGFKSFANKTIINFDEDFIGVVGPNGSGKSNVIDAIRWVFGEKSNKSLRGSNSSDVIFGGTEKRKKQNIAEVEIVLDNTDRHLEIEFDEVSFTRRLYRSGKSEYLINGVESRYKDIQELILDKGIGKNAFSIISQGKIEEIITTSAENRRILVEEVAGVLKYKKRKESALNKLSKTDDNLEQVNIILTEIEERRIPLEKQAIVAEKFLKYKSELESKEVNLLANRLKINEAKYKGLKEVTENAKLAIIKHENDEIQLELEREKINEKINENSIELNKIHLEINETLKNLNDKRADLKVFKERQLLQEGRTGREVELENNIIHLKEQLHTNSQKFHKQEVKIKNHLTKENEFAANIEELRVNLKSLYVKKNDLKQELNKTTPPFATRKLLEANIDGVYNTVGESFQVDLKYTEAISTILGGRVYDIITENRDIAIKAIDYLRKNKFGRQTLLPRDSMRNTNVDSTTLNKIQTIDGFVGVAYDLVTIENENEKVFSNLLGNVIVCVDIKSAKSIATAIVNKYRIVTLEGDVFQTSGAMSGGKTNRRNKIVIESNLTKVKNEIVKVESKLELIEEQYETFRKSYSQEQTQFQITQSIIDRLNSDLQLNELELSEISKNSTTVEGVKTIEEAILKFEEQLNELGVKQTHLEIFKNKATENVEEIYRNIKSIHDELKMINNEYNTNNVNLERLTISLKNDATILREEYNLSTQLAIEKANMNIDIDEYEQLVKTLKSKIRNLGPVNTLAIDEYTQLTERFDFIDSQRADLVVAKNKLEEIINNLDTFFIEAFSKTFNKLQTEFRHVYKELFGGGNADLVLTNEEDLLLSGVEIVAQPPGKKLQTISLLSGGEKSLTAIALLFAILRIKSLPFAILDEVEAALDESNVKRYGQYIKVFSERTQFIVITHRQGTMELVDALYGVTMQEKGVSTIVKVTLKEGESYV